VRVHRDISRLRVRLSNGREESPDLVPHPTHEDALVAALVYPHDVTIDGVDTIDVRGTVIAEEVPAFLQRPDHGMPRRPR
jgi:hypothetical protein